MKPASYYVRKALEKLLVQASEQDIEQNEAQDTIDSMNDLFLELESSGLPLGYTEISNLGEDVTIPDYARRFAILSLAAEIAPQYDVPIPTSLGVNLSQAKRAVERIVITQPIAIYPDTLPVGAGNDCGGRYTDQFYPGEEDETILTEQTGSIVIEDGTEADSE